MSTPFKPIEIPPGVVALATKNQRSSNWAEVNAVRWIEGKLQPIGGQELIAYDTAFASRCRAIHSWYDLAGNNYTAYVCETNVYVEAAGTLIEITPTDGLEPPANPSGGYGMGYFGMGPYGVPPRPGETVAADYAVLPDVWSVDNFGALLLVMTSPDGRLLWWDPATVGEVLTTVPNSPKGRCFVVTSDRFVMIFGMLTSDGTGSARRFGWCDQEDPTDWSFADVESEAGFYDIEPASPIVTAHSGRSGWVVFFTAKKAYVSRYLGLPFVYDYEELGDDCTPWSPASISSTSALIIWMGEQGAFSFDGTSIAPIECPVRAWIIDDIDPVNVRWQSAAAHIGQFSEFWWFFPQAGQQFNTRAAFYNYKEGWWSQAQMPRSAGITSSYTTHPIFADGLTPYRHESGVYFNDCALPYAETFDLNVASGGRLSTVKQMLVDIEGDETNITYALYYKNSRLSSAPESVTPQIAVRSDGYVDFRTTGRDIRLRFNVVGPAVTPFTLGQHLIDSVPRGDR
jgi:hypothetical protein